MSDQTPPADEPQSQLPDVPPADATAAEAVAPATPVADTPAAETPAVPAAPAQWPSQPAASTAYPDAGAYPPPAYPAYPPAAVAVAPQTSSNAIIALILAIVSWAVCPVIAAIVALVMAHQAAKEIDASGGRIQGSGLVTAARIVSWINIGLMAAVFVIGAFFLVLAVVAGGFGDVNVR